MTEHRQSGRAGGFYDWGLNLPDRPVPRRIIRNLDVRGRLVMADLEGPGCIRRFQVTGRNIGRELILRVYFDRQPVPAVEAPLADFFGLMHNHSELSTSPFRPGHPERASYRINTPFIVSNPHNAFTVYFPMPFADRARFEVTNDSDRPSHLFYYLDWHEYPGREMAETWRFCARWRREAPVPDRRDDFLVLDADGPGRLAGYVHSIDMLRDRHTMRWSHAGSDNIYIDGLADHPSYLRGHGAEDTFGASYAGHTYPAQTALFSDMPFYEQKDAGQADCLRHTDRQRMVGYRFFAHEAVCFDNSIHFRFGARAHDLAATVYWYSAAPVRPYGQVPPYRERLPGARPGRRYDLPLPESGRWWLCGPFPATAGVMKPPGARRFDPAETHEGRPWRFYRARRGFVDFNHLFRPAPSNANTATLEAVAFARCVVTAPRTGRAIATLGWDDELFLRLNDGRVRPLGQHDYFRARGVPLRLKRGVNRLVLALTNTTGLSRGAWTFSCRLLTDRGEALLPEAEGEEQSVPGYPALRLAFRAGLAPAPAGFLVFAPPYASTADPGMPCPALDLAASPQEMVFPSPAGPVTVEVSASENTTLGFRERPAAVFASGRGWSRLLRGEARAEAHPSGEAVSLTVSLAGLPDGEYNIVSYHHCHADGEKPVPLSLAIDGRPLPGGGVISGAGLDPKNMACFRVKRKIASRGEPLTLTWSAPGAAVINGLEIVPVGAGPRRRPKKNR